MALNPLISRKQWNLFSISPLGNLVKRTIRGLPLLLNIKSDRSTVLLLYEGAGDRTEEAVSEEKGSKLDGSGLKTLGLSSCLAGT